jgi:hypothetical protein
MNTSRRKLIAIHCTVWRDRRIVFRYKLGRWDTFDVFRPLDIREALHVALTRVEEAIPGSLAKAAEIDDKNWMKSKQRTRRYIAESPELIYIDRIDLRKQSEPVAGLHVLTNISWAKVPDILRLVCKAAAVEYGHLGSLSI